MANLKDNLKSKAVAKKSTKSKTIKELIQVMKPEIEKALPSVITPERFTRIALSAISNTPKLAECTRESFLGALMNSAQLGLEPNTPLGQAYLIPYGNKVQFQIGYKGLIDLAHRSGEFKTVYAKEVYENDEFHFEFGLDPKLEHIPATKDRGDVIFYYAVYRLVNGGFGFEVMSVEDVKKHGEKYSKTYKNGPWQTNFDEMAKKTLIKKVLKYAPIKTDFIRQMQEDTTVKSNIAESMADVENELEYNYVEAEELEVVEDDLSGTPFEEK